MPETTAQRQRQLGHTDLQTIATCLRWLVVFLIIYPVFVIGGVGYLLFVLPHHQEWLDATIGICGALGWAIIISSTIFVVTITNRLYSTKISVLCGILTFIPYTAWFVMLFLNFKTRKFLRAQGIPLGWLGASGPIHPTLTTPQKIPTSEDVPISNTLSYSQIDMATLIAFARHQRMLTWCIIAYITYIATAVAMAGILGTIATAMENDAMRLPVIISLDLLLIVVIIISAIFTMAVTKVLHGTAWAIVYAVLALLPYLGLALMFFINYRARKMLRAHGVELGIMGAK